MLIDWPIITLLMSICWAVSPKDTFNLLSKDNEMKEKKRRKENHIKMFLQGIKKHLLRYTSPKDA
jgi:hypothetical protein